MFNCFTNCPLVKGIAIGVGASALGFCLYIEETSDLFFRFRKAERMGSSDVPDRDAFTTRCLRRS